MSEQSQGVRSGHSGRRQRPAFLITIDTEGDNLWSNPKHVTTKNAAYIPRFQRLCESLGLRPTYLTNYEMAQSGLYQEFGRDVIYRSAAEIGMHLHAWDSPPLVPLTIDDSQTHPYLIEYPDQVMRDKLQFMTECLEDTFGIPVRSHRAGRWAIDGRYIRILRQLNYEIDCSVTPGVSWQANRGAPQGSGGPDYSRFPKNWYWIDDIDISRPGKAEANSSLLELPATVLERRRSPTGRVLREAKEALSRITRPGAPRDTGNLRMQQIWIRPGLNKVRDIIWALDEISLRSLPYAEFVLHSSELMPGGSPTFPDAAAIEKLYTELEEIFSRAVTKFDPMTLSEFRRSIISTNSPSGSLQKA